MGIIIELNICLPCDSLLDEIADIKTEKIIKYYPQIGAILDIIKEKAIESIKQDAELEHIIEVYKMSRERTCPGCGKSFPLPPARPKQVYCSRSCAAKGVQANKKNPQKGRIERIRGFVEKRKDLQIVDVIEGKLSHGTTDNRIFVTSKGARSLDGCTFYVVVAKD